MKIDNVYEAIDQWGISEPDRICFWETERQFTYGELKQASDSLAAYLEQHYADHRPIVIYGDLEIEMLAAFLGSVKAGHAYIPIEANTPQERIEMILEVAQPAAIIAIEPWPAIATTADLIENTAEIFAAGTTPSLTAPVLADDTFYIIFTSGTTGVPKGVQISHNNLLSFLNWELNDFGLTEGLRFLSQAPYSFDLSVMDTYPALTSGGSLTPLPKKIINDFKQLFATLPQMDVEVWVSTPSFMDICLMEPTFDEVHAKNLRYFLFCGEEMPKATALKLQERFPSAHIFNTYGPTEATVAVSGVELTPALLAAYDRVPIGYRKEDTRIVILDENGTALPDGEVGEIIIAGPSVSKGYMHNPEKTAAAFFTYEGQAAYRTGDAGRLENGLLLYDGRLDFQVKLHGYRIELEDIDHHLNEVTYVRQAMVVPKYQNHKVQQLVAYVVAADNPFEKDFALTKAIKEELGKTVMDYMIPQRFVYVERLPLTANGKIDRKGLINEVNS